MGLTPPPVCGHVWLVRNLNFFMPPSLNPVYEKGRGNLKNDK